MGAPGAGTGTAAGARGSGSEAKDGDREEAHPWRDLGGSCSGFGWEIGSCLRWGGGAIGGGCDGAGLLRGGQRTTSRGRERERERERRAARKDLIIIWIGACPIDQERFRRDNRPAVFFASAFWRSPRLLRTSRNMLRQQGEGRKGSEGARR